MLILRLYYLIRPICTFYSFSYWSILSGGKSFDLSKMFDFGKNLKPEALVLPLACNLHNPLNICGDDLFTFYTFKTLIVCTYTYTYCTLYIFFSFGYKILLSTCCKGSFKWTWYKNSTQMCALCKICIHGNFVLCLSWNCKTCSYNSLSFFQQSPKIILII